MAEEDAEEDNDVPFSTIVDKQVSVVDEEGNLRTFEAIKLDVIRAALHHCGYNESDTARQLNIARSTLRKIMEKNGISIERQYVYMPETKKK